MTSEFSQAQNPVLYLVDVGRDSKSIKILVFTKSALKNTRDVQIGQAYIKMQRFTGKNGKHMCMSQTFFWVHYNLKNEN